MEHPSRKIVSASIDHIPDILTLMEKYLVTNPTYTSVAELENEGFISYRLNEYDLRPWIECDDYIVLACIEDNKLIGFTIGCDLKKIPQAMQASFITLLESAGIFNAGKNFYHKLIVSGEGDQGVGTELMKALVNELHKRQYNHLLCLIAHKPHQNIKSIAFHQKFDFKLMNEIQDHQVVDGFYLKQLS